MKNSLIPILVSIFLIAAAFITPTTAGQSSNEKIPVIIGFKDMPDVALVKANGGEIKYQYHNIHAIAANLPVKATNRLKNNPNVAYIEEDVEVYILENNQSTPWGVDRIDAEIAHASNFTGEGVKVAIIDTGIDYTHPDLATNYAGGYDFVNDDEDPLDDEGHGTHVAGTIAAIDNDKGVVGVAPDAELYALKALNSSGIGYISDINAAIDWAINNDMDVISMSLGSSYNSVSQRKMCDAAYNAGIVLVASVGNNYGGPVSYPAAYKSVIAVSATNDQDEIAYFSSTGPQVELSAPGVDVNSTVLGDSYAVWSGTSMAAPHVSGVVALLLGADSALNPAEVRARLANTAIDLGPEGEDNYFGYGLIDAAAALDGFSTDPDPEIVPVSSEPLINEDYSRAGGKFVWATATINVTNNGTTDPVSGAIVSGYWIIDDMNQSEVSKITDSSGTVVFTSVSVKNPPENITFEFEVMGVTLE